MPSVLPLGDEPFAPIGPIELSPTVVIDFHEGAHAHDAPAVWWATLHTGHQAVEIGTCSGEHDLDTVLTMAAAVIMERSAHADDIYVSPEGDRWVLIGNWVLQARLTSTRPNHVRYGSPELARDVFNRLVHA